jgi:hypothetical protein
MFDLFRFFMLRPPEHPSDDEGIQVADGSPLAAQMKKARDGDEPLSAMRDIADAFAKSTDFVGLPGSAANATALNAFRSLLEARPQAHLSDLKSLIRTAFDHTAAEVVADSALVSDKSRVQDSLLAVKLASVPANVDHLALFVRLIDLIERTAADDLTLNEQGAVPKALIRLLVLPKYLFPLPSPLEQRKTQPPAPPVPPAGPSNAEKRVAALEGTLAELTTLQPDAFARPVASAPVQSAFVTPPQSEGFFARLLNLGSARNPGLVAIASARTSEGARLTLRPEAVAQFQPASHSLLRDLKIDLTTTSAPSAIATLKSELARAQQTVTAERAAIAPSFGGVGEPKLALDFVIPPPAIVPIPPPLPKAHGYIKPVGMADLLVVKYQLLRYERGEVAYIENILKGEISERSVRRLETTEETTVLETENTKEEERDLQSTERFELKNETENTVTAEGNLKSGNAFSPSYGPMLEFQGGTNSPVAGSQSQSSRQASNYSREVTSRSASKVTERVRKQVTLRKLREFEEKTGHTFNNTVAGATNVTGVYQWVEKVLRGQVFNYGRRLMFDIMVPEPAAFVQQAITGASPAALGLIKPFPFLLGIDNITEANYSNIAAFYGATGIEPPPQQWITVSKTFQGRNAFNNDTGFAFEQPIEEGYQATEGWVLLNHTVWNDNWGVDLSVGDWVTRATNADVGGWRFGLVNEVKSIAIGGAFFQVAAYSVSVQITCVRTARAMQGWQSRTHDAILRAYQQRLAEYEERLSNVLASTRIASLAQNPDENKKIIKEELKKSCISVFTYQHFDFFGAVELSPQGYVQIKLKDSEIQGEYVRFFEQAFEWEQMIYLFYPYFWGTKFFWLFKMRLDEVDPLFKDFLKAGEARVTVPVRPGFEKAVAHYLETGEIWDGKASLDVTSETYLPIMKEIQERDSVPGSETAYGDPWEVRLPTSLVTLRSDGKLPSWKEEPDGSGNWVEEDPA